MIAATEPRPRAPKSRGILFRAEMVRALLAGRKTQTRRLLRPELAAMCDFVDCDEQHDAAFSYAGTKEAGHSGIGWYAACGEYPEEGSDFLGPCPYGASGDRLWVRETMRSDCKGDWHYAADNALVQLDSADERVPQMLAWAHHKDAEHCASIHMPRWASRLEFKIVDVRIQRLQDIDESDAIAEGVLPWSKTDEHGETISATALEEFEALWKSIHGAASWKKNPWLWAISFKLVAR